MDFNKIYIISNIGLDEQYPYEKENEPKTYAAFLRRIHKVEKFPQSDICLERGPLVPIQGFYPVEEDIHNPFDELLV